MIETLICLLLITILFLFSVIMIIESVNNYYIDKSNKEKNDNFEHNFKLYLKYN